MSELLNCPFCGRHVDLVSNRDWHRIQGDHVETCPIADYEFAWPATGEGRNDCISAWNPRPDPAAVGVRGAPALTRQHVVIFENAFDRCKSDPDDKMSPAWRGLEAVFGVLGRRTPALFGWWREDDFRRVSDTDEYRAGDMLAVGYKPLCLMDPDWPLVNPQPGAVVGEQAWHDITKLRQYLEEAGHPEGGDALMTADSILRTLTNTDKGSAG